VTGMDIRPSRFTGEQIIGILRDQEVGAKTADVCRKHEVSSATFYKWKAKYFLPLYVRYLRWRPRDVVLQLGRSWLGGPRLFGDAATLRISPRLLLGFQIGSENRGRLTAGSVMLA
jgi:hypothetical protein